MFAQGIPYLIVRWYKTQWAFPTATSDAAGPNFNPDGKAFWHKHGNNLFMILNFSDGLLSYSDSLLDFSNIFIELFRHVPTNCRRIIPTFSMLYVPNVTVLLHIIYHELKSIKKIHLLPVMGYDSSCSEGMYIVKSSLYLNCIYV